MLNVVNKKPFKKILGIKNSNKLEKKNISVLPIVDKKNNLKSLEFNDFNSGFNNFIFNTEILIMAGGFGKRLMPITKKIPKPLIKIKKNIIRDNYQ